MYIDIYTHIFPADFFKRMGEIAPSLGNIGKRMQAVAAVHDLDVRFRAMDPFGDYRQIISLPNPPLEDITTPEQGMELARIGNDTMAELVEKNRDRFPGFVAALAMHSMDETMDELHRAVNDLGAVGVQIFTNVGGRPLDPSGFRARLRRHGGIRPADLDASRAHLRHDRLRGGGKIPLRNLVGARLAVRNLGRDGAPRAVGAVRPLSQHQDPDPSSRRHDPPISRNGSAPASRCSARAPRTRIIRRCCRR